jgi:uncharacterized protein YggU (UPF0235/DUF167 family)
LKEKAGKTYLTVKVTPRGSANKIQGIERDLFGDIVVKVMVTAIPDKGEANKAVLEELSKQLKIPKSSICIISGHKARIKVLTISAPATLVWSRMQSLETSVS